MHSHNGFLFVVADLDAAQKQRQKNLVAYLTRVNHE